MQHQEERDALISQIVALEQEMFENLHTFERSPCQDRLKTFRLMRWMTHSVLTTEILESSLEDLRQARSQGRNVMAEKYARIDDLIPGAGGPRAAIKRIVAAEDAWMAEVRQAFPRSFPRGGEGFHTYLSSELETLSPHTLGLLEGYVAKAREQGRNLVRERYENLFQKLGYTSLAAFEEKLRQGVPSDRSVALGGR